MKKLFIILLVLVAVNTKAQTLLNIAKGDTLNMTASSDTVSKTILLSTYSTGAIQVNETKISGTIIGKAYLSGSVDGVNYVPIDSSAAFTDQAVNSAIFTMNYTPYVYYKVDCRPMGSATGTLSAIVRVYYIFRQPNY